MKCSEFENLSMLYFDGGVDEQQKIDINEHIKICSSCRDSFNSMKRMIELLETEEEFKIDEGFTDQVMAKVNEYEESRIRTSKLIEKLAYPSAALFLCTGLLMWFLFIRNINVNYIVFRLINMLVILMDTIVAVLLNRSVLNFIRYVNSQLQFFMPVSLILIGIIAATGKYQEDREKA